MSLLLLLSIIHILDCHGKWTQFNSIKIVHYLHCFHLWMCWNSVDYNCVSCASQPRPRPYHNDEPIAKYANHGMISSHRTKLLQSKQCSCSYPQHDAHTKQQQYSLKKNWALKVRVIIRLTCNSCNFITVIYVCVYAERKLLQHFVIYAPLSYLFLCLLSHTTSLNLNI